MKLGATHQQGEHFWKALLPMWHAQEKRVEASQAVVDYSEDRMFDEDLWFQLAAELQDLSRSYLDSAIYASLLMERAYDLEADPGETRDLKDEGLGWPQALCHRLTAEIERLSQPLAQPEAMTLQRDLERQLRELGYAEE